jgi:hypothetical protein
MGEHKNALKIAQKALKEITGELKKLNNLSGA